MPTMKMSRLEIMESYSENYQKQPFETHQQAFPNSTRIQMFKRNDITYYSDTKNPTELIDKYEYQFEWFGFMDMAEAFGMRFQKAAPDFYIGMSAEDVPFGKLTMLERECILNNEVKKAALGFVKIFHGRIKLLENEKCFSRTDSKKPLLKTKALIDKISELGQKVSDRGMKIYYTLTQRHGNLILDVNVSMYKQEYLWENKRIQIILAEVLSDGYVTGVKSKDTLITGWNMDMPDNIHAVYNLTRELEEAKSRLYNLKRLLSDYNVK